MTFDTFDQDILNHTFSTSLALKLETLMYDYNSKTVELDLLSISPDMSTTKWSLIFKEVVFFKIYNVTKLPDKNNLQFHFLLPFDID